MMDVCSDGQYDGNDRVAGQRLTRPPYFLRSAPTDNWYARPIEGIRPVVDLNIMKVLRIEDDSRARRFYRCRTPGRGRKHCLDPKTQHLVVAARIRLSRLRSRPLYELNHRAVPFVRRVP